MNAASRPVETRTPRYADCIAASLLTIGHRGDSVEGFLAPLADIDGIPQLQAKPDPLAPPEATL